jgi:hypothetical protein
MPFVRNDTAYREWLEQHPGDSFSTTRLTGRIPDYLVLHRADCPTIQVRSCPRPASTSSCLIARPWPPR